MAEIQRTHVPGDDVDKQAYLREYINAKMDDGEALTLYFERRGIIMEKLALICIIKSDQEENLHVLQCFSSHYALDKKLFQYAPILTLTHIDDLVRTTHRDMEESRKAFDGSAHVLIAAGGPGSFSRPVATRATGMAREER